MSRLGVGSQQRRCPACTGIVRARDGRGSVTSVSAPHAGFGLPHRATLHLVGGSPSKPPERHDDSEDCYRGERHYREPPARVLSVRVEERSDDQYHVTTQKIEAQQEGKDDNYPAK